MLPPPRHILAVILAIMLIALSYLGGMLAGPDAASGKRLTALPTRVVRGQDSAQLTVDVGGAVRSPGVYQVHAGSRVRDVISRAGGATPSADLGLVNRAQPVVDGQQIIVPAAASQSAAGQSGSTSQGAASHSGAGARVSINSATLEQLDTLSGVGPATAAAIVDDRTSNGPFADVGDLDRVAGIGPATIAALEDQVTL